MTYYSTTKRACQGDSLEGMCRRTGVFTSGIISRTHMRFTQAGIFRMSLTSGLPQMYGNAKATDAPALEEI